VPVILTNDFPPDAGGIQRLMSQLAVALAGAGLGVVVVAPKTTGFEATDRALPFPVIRYERLGTKLLDTISMMAAYLRALRTGHRTTIASIWWPSGFVVAILPRWIRGRFAVLAHGSEIMPHRHGIRRSIMRYVYRSADIVLSNSKFTSALLSECGGDANVTILPLATDLTAISPERAGEPTLLSVGRLVRRKGFDKMLEAVSRLRVDYPTLKYVVVGAGPQGDELAQLTERLGIGRHVDFRGKLSDFELAKAYAEAWVFALPTRRIVDDVEGFGLVYLEAAMAELPTLGGIESGASDAIVDGQTGFLVDGDDVSAIESALRNLLSDRTLAARLGKQGRERAESLTWDKTARAALEALDAPRPSGRR